MGKGLKEQERDFVVYARPSKLEVYRAPTLSP